MGSNDESEAQKRERRAAEKVELETKNMAAEDKRIYEEEQAARKTKQTDRNKRQRNMGGGGRKGLMYRQNEAGVNQTTPQAATQPVTTANKKRML